MIANGSLMRLITSAAVVVTCATQCVACASFWSGPWPRMDIDYSGLGTTKIAYVVREQWMNREQDVSAGVLKLIQSSYPNSAIQASDMEAIGATCSDASAKTCSYSGYITFTLNPAPTAERASARHRIQVDVTIDFASAPIHVFAVKRETKE